MAALKAEKKADQLDVRTAARRAFSWAVAMAETSVVCWVAHAVGSSAAWMGVGRVAKKAEPQVAQTAGQRAVSKVA